VSPRSPKKKPAVKGKAKAAKKSAPPKKRAKPKPAKKAAARPKAKPKAKPRPARRAAEPQSLESEIAVEDVEQGAKQFAYVLTPVEPEPPFALGSIIAARPPLPPPPPFPTRVQAPFAERAAGAGSCAQCNEGIARAAWQVVVTDDGATIHPGCAFAWMQAHLEDHDETEAWMATLVEHLSESDRAELLAALDRD
jgi:hypothetical protein